MKKARQRPNFLQKFVNITKLELRISEKVLNFSQICQKQALNILFSSTSKKDKKKWPKHFISGKQFQERPYDNPV